ncbi:hypothetical protein HD598_001936 [Neomicrococcus aestuarii]|uniref:Uncharacterized protein n=1 Tax=Neomicrococcus aestuarii TaxID=556325 RepID=A0A7W8TUQ5_9MICC|nr:hypothetical protein [Neomicrococcus aestuarii]
MFSRKRRFGWFSPSLVSFNEVAVNGVTTGLAGIPANIYYNLEE